MNKKYLLYYVHFLYSIGDVDIHDCCIYKTEINN